MSVKLLTEHHLKFLSLKEAAQAHLSLHLSKCHIVGNHMSRPNYLVVLGLTFGLSLNLHSNFMYASNKGSD